MTRIAKKVCKKLLVFTAVVVGSCCVLFGCNKTGDSQSSSSTPAPTPAHTHTLTKVTANAPTCTQTGNEEYFVCECGDMFADENANTALTAIPVLEKTAHRGKCTVLYHLTKLMGFVFTVYCFLVLFVKIRVARTSVTSE